MEIVALQLPTVTFILTRKIVHFRTIRTRRFLAKINFSQNTYSSINTILKTIYFAHNAARRLKRLVLCEL